MNWNYEIEVALKHPVNLTVDVLGQQVNLRLDLSAAATNPGKIEGGISFDCKPPPYIEGCYCIMHNLRRRDPVITTQLETDVYEAANIVGGAAGAITPQYVSLEAPTIELSSRMEITATNGGKAYNVFVESELNYTPGKVIIDPPDLEDVPLPPPFDAATIPIGPFPFSMGQPVTSTHRAQYIVACCTWDAMLPEFDRADGEPLRDVDYIPSDELIECHCEDFSSTHIQSGPIVSNQTVKWKIKAVEGPCRWRTVRVRREHPEQGGTLRKVDQGEKSEKEH